MFDLGLYRRDALNLLSAFKSSFTFLDIFSKRSTVVTNFAFECVQKKGGLYRLADLFINGFLIRYRSSDPDFNDLGILHDNDQHDLLVTFFLEKLANMYLDDALKQSDFKVLNFALACLIGEKVTPANAHLFEVYFKDIYDQFMDDFFYIYNEYYYLERNKV